jgi:polyisoprenoid-binding protein YceI
MDVDRFPTMRYDLRGASTRLATGAEGAGLLLHGTLRLHGVARPVDVPVTVARTGDTLRVAGTFPVNVTDYGVGGLRRMGRLLRMREGIEVHLALRFVVGG